METNFFDTPASGNLLIFLFIFILILLKFYYFYFRNKQLHQNRILKRLVCPFCNNINPLGYRVCGRCGRSITKNQVGVICLNCGYIGSMDKYISSTEFTITFLLLLIPFVFPSLIYFIFYRNRKICRNCGRMIRKSDYRI